MKNEAESQAVFAVSYVRNVRGRAMLPDSTVLVKTASMRRFLNMYPQFMFYAKILKISQYFYLKIVIFIAVKNCSVIVTTFQHINQCMVT